MLLDADRSSLWWRTKENLHQKVFDYVEGVEKEEEVVFRNHVKHAKLYANCDLLGFRRSGQAFDRRMLNVVTENVTQSVVDTAGAIIGQNQPRPVFLTDYGDFSMQRKAKLLTQYMEGTFRSIKYYRESAKAFKDACIFGTGAVKFFPRDGKVMGERVLIDEIVVDEEECISTPRPRQIHQRKFVDRYVLAGLFPEHEDIIEESCAGRTRREHWAQFRALESHQVVVIESWRLSSSPGKNDGRHTIVTDKGVLFDEPWSHEWFPFAIFRWNELPTGFYGQGLVEQLSGKQLELNRINQFITLAHKLIASPRVFVDVASKILRTHIERSDVGQIIPYRGKPPVFMTPQAVGAEIYAYKQTVRSTMFEDAGISQMSAQAKTQPGVESAVAQRELVQRQQARFTDKEVQFEEMSLEATDRILRLSKLLHKGGTNPKAVFREKNFIKTIPWSDVDMEDDRFQMIAEASSILSKTPAGRKQDAIEMGQAGIVDQKTAVRLLAHPDIKYEESMVTASIEDIEAVIEQILEGGEFIPPDPMQDLQLGIKRMTMAYNKVRHRGAPESVLDDLRTWVQLANDMLMQAQQPPEMPMDPSAPMDPAAMATPAPMPMEQPQSAFAPTAMNIQATRIPV
jgi:hypothetical protein